MLPADVTRRAAAGETVCREGSGFGFGGSSRSSCSGITKESPSDFLSDLSTG